MTNENLKILCIEDSLTQQAYFKGKFCPDCEVVFATSIVGGLKELRNHRFNFSHVVLDLILDEETEPEDVFVRSTIMSLNQVCNQNGIKFAIYSANIEHFQAFKKGDDDDKLFNWIHVSGKSKLSVD